MNAAPHFYSRALRCRRIVIRLGVALAVTLVGALAAARPAAAAGDFAAPERVREYRLKVPAKRVAAARSQVGSTDLAALGDDQGLAKYWQQQYRWTAAERALNRYPQYLARIGGVDLPFYYVRGERRDAPLLVLTQSAPGSILQLLDAVDALVHPSRHGGRADDAYTVVIPALQGSAFSSIEPAPDAELDNARLWHELLTEVIGRPRYWIHGDGIGAGVAQQLLRQYPQAASASDRGALPAMVPNDALLTDLLLSRLRRAGMQANLRLTAAALAGGDAEFWPAYISDPIVLKKSEVIVTEVGAGAPAGR